MNFKPSWWFWQHISTRAHLSKEINQRVCVCHISMCNLSQKCMAHFRSAQHKGSNFGRFWICLALPSSRVILLMIKRFFEHLANERASKCVCECVCGLFKLVCFSVQRIQNSNNTNNLWKSHTNFIFKPIEQHTIAAPHIIGCWYRTSNNSNLGVFYLLPRCFSYTY